MNKLYIGLIGLAGLFICLIVIFAFQLGYKTAQSERYLAQYEQSADDLTTVIVNMENLTWAANEASQRLSEQIHLTEVTNAQSTSEIKNALKKSANQRINCVFDANSLQQLDNAYRNATAATTGGVSSAVSGTGAARK